MHLVSDWRLEEKCGLLMREAGMGERGRGGDQVVLVGRGCKAPFRVGIRRSPPSYALVRSVWVVPLIRV